MSDWPIGLKPTVDDAPLRIMACEPFLQRLQLKRIRPRQNSSVDIAHLQSQKTPITYPTQHVEHIPSSRVLEPLHGVQNLWPWTEQEILQNSNAIHSQ